MPATAASQLIFFVTAMVIATSIAGVMIGSIASFSNSMRKQANSLGQELGTEITIVNDPAAMPYNQTNRTLIIYVKNTGSTTIGNPDATVVLINGTAFTNLTVTLLTNATAWSAGVTAQILVGDANLAAGQDYRLKVAAEKGTAAVFDFRL